MDRDAGQCWGSVLMKSLGAPPFLFWCLASRDANFAICWLLVISGKEMWTVVSSALALARQNPTPFVSAVRIVEREEALDRVLLEQRGSNRSNSRPLPPQRPRYWRASFFQVSTNSCQSFFFHCNALLNHECSPLRYLRKAFLHGFVAFPLCKRVGRAWQATSQPSSTVLWLTWPLYATCWSTVSHLIIS